MRTTALSLALTATACGAPVTTGAAPGPDAPVPASEPRSTLALRIELEPRGDCEEAFDLALYENRAVDLVSWDARRGACDARRIDVRFFSGRTTETEMLEAVRRLATKVERTK